MFAICIFMLYKSTRECFVFANTCEVTEMNVGTPKMCLESVQVSVGLNLDCFKHMPERKAFGTSNVLVGILLRGPFLCPGP